MHLVFYADKGGVGKSTLTYHVATRLVQLEQAPVLVDLDRRLTSYNWAHRGEYVIAESLTEVRARRQLPAIGLWDTPAHPPVDLRKMLRELPNALFLIITQTDPASLDAAVRMQREFSGEGSDARIVFSQVWPQSHDAVMLQSQLRELDVPYLTSAVRFYRAYHHAHWDGVAVCDRSYPSADNAWGDICELVSEILGIYKERFHVVA